MHEQEHRARGKSISTSTSISEGTRAEISQTHHGAVQGRAAIGGLDTGKGRRVDERAARKRTTDMNVSAFTIFGNPTLGMSKLCPRSSEVKCINQDIRMPYARSLRGYAVDAVCAA